MNKRELIAAAARQSGVTQVQTRETLEAILDVIAKTLTTGDQVTLAGFGRFEPKDYTGRPVRHPRTRETYETESRLLPSFHPYPMLKRRVREGDNE
jgi:DNA-binding protein HU-beta